MGWGRCRADSLPTRQPPRPWQPGTSPSSEGRVGGRWAGRRRTPAPPARLGCGRGPAARKCGASATPIIITSNLSLKITQSQVKEDYRAHEPSSQAAVAAWAPRTPSPGRQGSHGAAATRACTRRSVCTGRAVCTQTLAPVGAHGCQGGHRPLRAPVGGRHPRSPARPLSPPQSHPPRDSLGVCTLLRCLMNGKWFWGQSLLSVHPAPRQAPSTGGFGG